VTFTLDGQLTRSNPDRDLTKTGAGSMILNSPNGSSLGSGGNGGFVVDAGTVRIANTSGSATGVGYTTVTTGARLEGNGIIQTEGNAASGTDDISVFGGTLAPGNSIGTITIGDSGGDSEQLFIAGNDGSTDFDGTLEIEFDDVTSDFLDVYGTLTLNTGLDSILQLENFNLGATANQIYTIASYDTLEGTFDQIVNNTGLTLDGSFGTGGVDYNYLAGNDIAVRFIPEPSTATLLLLGLAGLLRRRLRS